MLYIYSLKKEITIGIPIDKNTNEKLEGSLIIPESSNGLIIFVHGSGSSRYSTRNKFVSDFFNKDGLSTLLIDLLTEKEEKKDNITKEYRFNIPLLANRLLSITDWVLRNDNEFKSVSRLLGYFGASTGATASLIAADKISDKISAIVSRGGRVDLASDYTSLTQITCPILFLVGENDSPVIEWNKKVIEKQLINVKKKKMVIIPGASHLFDEPGKLEEVAKYASGWFRCYFQIKEKNSKR